MCILWLAILPESGAANGVPEVALPGDQRVEWVLCHNRDEVLARPTGEAHHWADGRCGGATGRSGPCELREGEEHIFGGRDLSGGGSWLAVSTRDGSVAALTNIREKTLPAARNAASMARRRRWVFLPATVAACGLVWSRCWAPEKAVTSQVWLDVSLGLIALAGFVLACLTNGTPRWLMLPEAKSLRSRGDIVRGFLATDLDARTYCSRLSSAHESKTSFGPFNFVAQRDGEWVYVKNRGATEPRSLSPGLYVVSNDKQLHSSWFKVRRGRDLFSAVSVSPGNGARGFVESALNMMRDDRRAEFRALGREPPQTGFGVELEEKMSSIFVRHEGGYGTRTHTVVLGSRETILFAEKTFAGGRWGEPTFHTIPIPVRRTLSQQQQEQ